LDYEKYLKEHFGSPNELSLSLDKSPEIDIEAFMIFKGFPPFILRLGFWRFQFNGRICY